MRTAFDTEGYHRRIARSKPFLNTANKQRRLAWALEHEHWSIQDWLRVIWTDEAAFYVGGFRGNTWVTRNAQEEYHEQCLLPKFQRLLHVMIWGSICSDRIGPLVIWDKSWGKITLKSYVKHITEPAILPFYESEMTHSWPYLTYLMQDGAPAHRAKNTREFEEKNGVVRLEWPASSPDLNPIEILWRNMKDKLDRVPIRPTTVADMRLELQAMWGNLDPKVDTLPYIMSLPTRIKAVISANGGHTKF